MARREVVSMTQRGRLEPQDKMGGEGAKATHTLPWKTCSI